MSNIALRNLSAGELSPAYYARTDLQRYATGLRTCRNFICRREGGIANRPGTAYVAETKYPDLVNIGTTVRLIEFEFNDEQTYVLEVGSEYIRFYQDGAPVTVSGVTAWSNATTYAVGDLASHFGVNYYAVQAHINQSPPNATYWYPLTDDIYEMPTPYDLAAVTELQMIQSADTLVLVHARFNPRELTRLAHTRWTLTLIPFGITAAPPTGLATTGAAGAAVAYVVTTIATDTFEESQASTPVTTNTVATAGAPVTVSWTAPVGTTARQYWIYRSNDGGQNYGFLGLANAPTLQFRDVGDPTNDSIVPPILDTFGFASGARWPAAVTYYQQRLVFGNATGAPETVWASRTGSFRNFATSFPLQADDALAFTLAGRRVNAIRHFVDAGRLFTFTQGDIWVIEGDEAGILRPDAINARRVLAHGASRVPPLVISDTPVYVQARGSIVRDVVNGGASGFQSRDLTLFAAHLVNGYTIVDWAYAETPDSVLWAVRSDGVLLSLTYLPDRDIWGWARHDLGEAGAVESVCSVPEGDEDAVYVVVRRTVPGSGGFIRTVERFASRRITPLIDVRDLIFMDATLSYDGRNTTSKEMTLSGGVAWNEGETLTLTATASTFTSGDVGNAVVFYDPDDLTVELVRVTIEGYTGATVVTVRPSGTVPVALRGIPKTQWGLAVDSLTGLQHLNGFGVSILADGAVVANPNTTGDGRAFASETVVNGGSVTLASPAVVIHVGLPYLSDVETLDLDTPGGPSLKDRRTNVNKLTLMVEASRGFWAGGEPPTDDDTDPLDGLNEQSMREVADAYGVTGLKTGTFDLSIENNWNQSGRVFIRQPDPLPLTINAIIPTGFIP